MRPTNVYDQMSVAKRGGRVTASRYRPAIVHAIGRTSPGRRASRRGSSIDAAAASRISVTTTAGGADLWEISTAPVHPAEASASPHRDGGIRGAGSDGR